MANSQDKVIRLLSVSHRKSELPKIQFLVPQAFEEGDLGPPPTLGDLYNWVELWPALPILPLAAHGPQQALPAAWRALGFQTGHQT